MQPDVILSERPQSREGLSDITERRYPERVEMSHRGFSAQRRLNESRDWVHNISLELTAIWIK
jgi:hypothetical protein